MRPFWRPSRAGAYAQQRYKRGLAAYRSHNRGFFSLCFGPFILLGLAGLAFEGHLGTWAAGAFFGLGAAALIILRDSPPAYIEKWRQGAEGERKTERALQRLDRSRWLVLHDIEAPMATMTTSSSARRGSFCSRPNICAGP